MFDAIKVAMFYPIQVQSIAGFDVNGFAGYNVLLYHRSFVGGRHRPAKAAENQEKEKTER